MSKFTTSKMFNIDKFAKKFYPQVHVLSSVIPGLPAYHSVKIHRMHNEHNRVPTMRCFEKVA